MEDHEEKGSEFLRRKHNYVRSTVRFDYQPDICKDYKETGHCSFGDSCKFLHDRSDYKHSWQLDQEYARGEYKDEDDDKYLIRDDDESEQQQDLSICPICNEEFKDPIVTKCKHNFCGSCAEEKCSDKCFICQRPTSGIFKVAKIDVTKKKQPTAGQSGDCSSMRRDKDAEEQSPSASPGRNNSNEHDDNDYSDESRD